MKNKKIGGYLLFLAALWGGIGSASAQSIVPKFGVEWGGALSMYSNYHYNYLTEENMRVDEKGYEFSPYMNGSIVGCLGFYAGRHLAFDLSSGYEGVKHGIRVFPLAVRTTYFLQDWRGDSDFILAGAGYGFRHNERTTSLYRIGYGRRLRISRSFHLDFMLSAQLCLDKPDVVVDSYSGVPVTEERLRYSGAAYTSLNFCIQFSF